MYPDQEDRKQAGKKNMQLFVACLQVSISLQQTRSLHWTLLENHGDAMRHYIRARYAHIETLMLVQSQDAIVAVREHLVDMLRLNSGDKLVLYDLSYQTYTFALVRTKNATTLSNGRE